MVLGLKKKLIYGVISGLIPLLELCTTVGMLKEDGIKFITCSLQQD
jgi:hypothetical protein